MADEEEKNSEEESQEETKEEESESSDEEKTDEEESKEEEGEEEKKEEKEEEFVDPEKVEIETRGAEPPKKPEEPTGDEEEVDPDDKKTISKVVKDELAPITEQLSRVKKLENQTEVNAFLAGKPEFNKYRGVILKYMDHPSYSLVPVQNIAAIVAAKDLQKMGAEKERQANQKAKETQGGGSTARKPTGKTDWLGASKEEFEAQKSKVLGRQGA